MCQASHIGGSHVDRVGLAFSLFLYGRCQLVSSLSLSLTASPVPVFKIKPISPTNPFIDSVVFVVGGGTALAARRSPPLLPTEFRRSSVRERARNQANLQREDMEEEDERGLLLGEERAKEGETRRVEQTLSARLVAESKKVWAIAGPAVFTRSCMFGVSVVSQSFIGHVGSTELAAFALVNTVLMQFAIGILLGMASALETLCGQAFGAKQHHMLGIYLQRSWIILLMSVGVLLPIFIFTTPILRFFGQQEAIALMAGTVSLWFIPIIFSFIFSYSIQMYLQAQCKNMQIAYFATATFVLHIFFSWLMVSHLLLGVKGAMTAMILSSWLPIFGLLLYVFCGGCPDTWKGFSASAFSDLWPLIKLSLSSGLMICLELWYNTILLLFAGHMIDAEVAIDALSICLSINGWEVMIALGFLTSACVRVANELGAGNAKDAKFSIVVNVATSFAIGVVLFILFLSFHGSLAFIFTENPKVARAVIDLSPLLAFSILLNSVQPVLSGVAVGAGWQNVVAYVNLGSYYLIGVPLGVALGYSTGYHVKGIWIGMMLGTAVQTVVLSYITWGKDWEKQVALAQAHVNKWLVPAPEGEAVELKSHDQLQRRQRTYEKSSSSLHE